jgi:Cu-Zn family superoxide dismutase
MILGMSLCFTVKATPVVVDMNLVDEQGTGSSVGTVTISETKYGLLFTPNIRLSPAGIHGFHIHANGQCSPAMKGNKMVAAAAAGDHFDPRNTGKHLGPYNPDGHAGDLPAIYIADTGTVNIPVLAPRLKTLNEIRDKALIIHSGGDNFSDSPHPLGGGGERIVCGVIR